MFLYVLVWLLLAMLSFSRWRHSQGALLFVVIVLIFIAGGRALNVGVDTKAYADIFSDIQEVGYLPYLEPGWNLLNILVGKLTSNYNVLLFVVSILTFLPLCKVVIKESESNYIFPFFIYYSTHIYFASFNVSRQYMALSWILLSYYYLFHNRRAKWLLALGVACSIHASSILSLVVIFLVRLKLQMCHYVVLFIMAFLVGTVLDDSLLRVFAFQYTSYVVNGAYRDSSFVATILTLAMTLLAIIILRTSKKELYVNSWFKIYMFSAIILNCTYKLEYGARIYVLFSIAQLIFFPLYIRNNNISNTHGVIGIGVCYFLVLFLRMLLVNANNILPYKNVFF